VVLALVALLVLLPLATFAYHNRSALVQRAQQVTIFAGGKGSDRPASTLAQNILKVAGVFVLGGDANLGDNVPGRPPLPVVLMLALGAGLVVALRRSRRAEYALCLIWFVWLLAPSVLTKAAPSLRRAIGATPPLALLAAVGLAWAVDGVQGLAARRKAPTALGPVLGGLLAVGVLGYALAWGYQYYFVDWGGDKALYHEFDAGLVELGQYGAVAPAGTGLYYTPAALGDVLHLPLTWQVRDRDLRSFDGHWGLVLPPVRPQSSFYLVRTFLDGARTLPSLRAFYPTGRVAHEVHDLSGSTYGVVFAVDTSASPTLQIQNRIAANFDNQVELLGSNFSQPELRAGDTLTVTLFWRATAGPTEASHTVFTHLLGAPNPADGTAQWAGQDSPPFHNSYPTIHWAQGEIIVDLHPILIPREAPAGEYRVEAGLYTPERGSARLSIIGPDGKVAGDSLQLGSVTIGR